MSEASRVLLFPEPMRINQPSEIRTLEWIEQPTQADADIFERGITESIVTNLIRLGASPAEIGRQMGAFWLAVGVEAERVMNIQQGQA